jgi:hypothetical protein
MLISTFKNITMPAITSDFLPTIMALLDVSSDNPTWTMDGISLLPFITAENTSLSRPKPLGFSWGGLHVIIDNEWKLMNKPSKGQCNYQEPYNHGKLDDFYLFNLDRDYHELHDQKAAEPARLAAMQAQLTEFLASIANSQHNETKCAGGRRPPHPHPPPPPPDPPVPPSTSCNFTQGEGLVCGNAYERKVHTKEQCCGECMADKLCTAATFNKGKCNVKHVAFPSDCPRATDRGPGSFVCVPHRN